MGRDLGRPAAGPRARRIAQLGAACAALAYLLTWERIFLDREGNPENVIEYLIATREIHDSGIAGPWALMGAAVETWFPLTDPAPPEGSGRLYEVWPVDDAGNVGGPEGP